MLRKIALGLVTLVVVIVVGAAFLWSNLDHLIKSAVEKYGSAATQTEVHLDGVTLSLSSGKGSLNGLSVANPKGFPAAKAFDLGSVAVMVDTSSIAGDGPIVIRSVAIDKPQVTFSLANNGTTNLQTLQHNVEAYASSMAGGGAPVPANNANGGKPARKIIIDDLTISNGQVAISQESLQGKQLSTSLPAIHLAGIGRSSGGVTAAQVAEQLMDSLGGASVQAALTALAKAKISGALGAVPGSAIGGAALDAVGNKVKGMFGQ